MSATPPAAPSSAGLWPWLAAWGSRWSRLAPLARDLILILIAKAIVLSLIWFAFFREPAAPGMAMEPQRVETRLLAPSPASEASHAVH